MLVVRVLRDGAVVRELEMADHLFELGLSREEMLEHANRLEGHPDNVAAALSGGFVICAELDGRVISTRVDSPEGLEGILVIPHEPVSTNDARMAIPAEVPVGDLVGNVSAAALLIGLACLAGTRAAWGRLAPRAWS